MVNRRDDMVLSGFAPFWLFCADMSTVNSLYSIPRPLYTQY